MSVAAAAAIDALVASGTVPGMALAVVDRSGVVYEHYAGWADRERLVPVGPETRFALASLTKPLVAMAALVAVEHGLVDLDAPLAEHVAGVAPWVTLRSTLAHYSGLPESVAPDVVGLAVPTTWPALRAAYARVAPVAGPGDRRIYSNVGYALAGAAIEAAAGVPIDRYLAEAVLAPLGLTKTSLGGEGAHVRDAGLWTRGVPMFNTPWLAALPLPQSGGWSTARDYACFLGSLLGSGPAPLVRPELAAELLTNQGGVLAGGVGSFMTWERADWALGFELRGTKTPHYTGEVLPPSAATHFGAAGTLCFLDVERGLGAALLANRGTYSGWMLRDEAWPAIIRSVGS